VLAESKYNARADLWSLGVILYRCVTGRLPYEAKSVKKLKLLHNRAPSMPHAISFDLEDILKGLLQADPARRISHDEIRRHPYLRGGALFGSEEPRTGAGPSTGMLTASTDATSATDAHEAVEGPVVAPGAEKDGAVADKGQRRPSLETHGSQARAPPPLTADSAPRIGETGREQQAATTGSRQGQAARDTATTGAAATAAAAAAAATEQLGHAGSNSDSYVLVDDGQAQIDELLDAGAGRREQQKGVVSLITRRLQQLYRGASSSGPSSQDAADFVQRVAQLVGPAEAIMDLASLRWSPAADPRSRSGSNVSVLASMATTTAGDSVEKASSRAETDESREPVTREQCEALLLYNRALSVLRSGLRKLRHAVQDKEELLQATEVRVCIEELGVLYRRCLAAMEQLRDDGVSNAAKTMPKLQTAEHMLCDYALSLCREGATDETEGKLTSSHDFYKRALVLLNVIVEDVPAEVGVGIGWGVGGVGGERYASLFYSLPRLHALTDSSYQTQKRDYLSRYIKSTKRRLNEVTVAIETAGAAGSGAQPSDSTVAREVLEAQDSPDAAVQAGHGGEAPHAPAHAIMVPQPHAQHPQQYQTPSHPMMAYAGQGQAHPHYYHVGSPGHMTMNMSPPQFAPGPLAATPPPHGQQPGMYAHPAHPTHHPHQPSPPGPHYYYHQGTPPQGYYAPQGMSPPTSTMAIAGPGQHYDQGHYAAYPPSGSVGVPSYTQQHAQGSPASGLGYGGQPYVGGTPPTPPQYLPQQQQQQQGYGQQQQQQQQQQQALPPVFFSSGMTPPGSSSALQGSGQGSQSLGRCSQCNAVISGGMNFCSGCGAHLSQVGLRSSLRRSQDSSLSLASQGNYPGSSGSLASSHGNQ
jgi:hypothetical protein